MDTRKKCGKINLSDTTQDLLEEKMITNNFARLCVIANCQAWPLAQILATLSQSQVRFISLTDVVTPGSFSHTSAMRMLDEAHLRDELVFSFNAGSPFAPLDTLSLREVFGERLKTFTSVRFDGVHPDMTYFGRFKNRWLGTMGEYHSKLIIYSFLNGKSETECERLFNADVYSRIGYFDMWERSADILLARDEQCDIQFAKSFLELAKSETSLFTMNHPTAVTFFELASSLLQAVGIERQLAGRHLFANPLFSGYSWPIYPEIAEYHSLPYKTGMAFHKPQSSVEDTFFPRSMSLREYIQAEYALYRSYDFELLQQGAEEIGCWNRIRGALN